MWLWNRLIHMDDSRLTKKVFLYDYNLCKDNWCHEMKLIFGKVEQLDVFNNHLCSRQFPLLQNQFKSAAFFIT